MNCGIYVIQNIVTGDCYFGQSISIKQKLNNHGLALLRNVNKHTRLQRAFNKYGCENFIFAVILYCEQAELTHYEQLCVDIFQSTYNLSRECVNSVKGLKQSLEHRHKIAIAHLRENLYDVTRQRLSASQKGRIISEEHRHKISKTLSGRPSGRKGIKFSAEARHNMSVAHKGKPSCRKGAHASEEARHNMSIAHRVENLSEIARHNIANGQRGRKVSDETRHKLSMMLRGHPVSKATRDKISIILRARHARLSDEHKRKISDSLRKHYANKLEIKQ